MSFCRPFQSYWQSLLIRSSSLPVSPFICQNFSPLLPSLSMLALVCIPVCLFAFFLFAFFLFIRCLFAFCLFAFWPFQHFLSHGVTLSIISIAPPISLMAILSIPFFSTPYFCTQATVLDLFLFLCMRAIVLVKCPSLLMLAIVFT